MSTVPEVARFKFETPQVDIDRCLAIEESVKPDEMALYLECMNGIKLCDRIKSPRPLDREGRDVRNGCILVGVFVAYRKPLSQPKQRKQQC
jgi:hypothetical protein